MGKQYKTRCENCGKPHYFMANSKRLSIKCNGKHKRIILDKEIIVTCRKEIINKGFIFQPKEVKGRLKLKNMKYGKMADLMGRT